MTSFGEHLRCHIFWASTKSISKFTGPDAFPTESKVCYFEIAIFVNHDIFRFDISVDDFLAVKVLNSH